MANYRPPKNTFYKNYIYSNKKKTLVAGFLTGLLAKRKRAGLFRQPKVKIPQKHNRKMVWDMRIKCLETKNIVIMHKSLTAWGGWATRRIQYTIVKVSKRGNCTFGKRIIEKYRIPILRVELVYKTWGELVYRQHIVGCVSDLLVVGCHCWRFSITLTQRCSGYPCNRQIWFFKFMFRVHNVKVWMMTVQLVHP